MRILHATDCYLPRLGGIELHVHDLAQRQRELGDDVTVLTRTPLPDGVEDLRESTVLRLAHLDQETLHELAPDVVHVHLSVVSPFALTVARLAAALAIPTVITVHSLWSDIARLAPLVRSTLGAHRWPVVWTAVSRQAPAYVEQVVAQEVGVIPNAVDIEFWRNRPAATFAAPTGEWQPTILSVMRLTTVKRTIPLARVLHGVAAETDMRAVIIGDGPKRAALERYLRRHDLTDRVHVAGARGREEVRSAMAHAALFVAPAYRESFGIAALEARTTGLPVVAQASSGVASFIRHGREGLLAQDDRTLVRHTIELVRNVSLREEITHHNRVVAPSLSWSTALRTNLDAYARAGARIPAANVGAASHPAHPLAADR